MLDLHELVDLAIERTVMFLTACSGIWLANLIAIGFAADEQLEWQTNTELDRATKLAISVDWTDAPLRSQLTEFSRQQRIGVFIDRRTDPSTKISAALADATWEQFLLAIADKAELGTCRIDDIYYVGPVKSAQLLPILIEQSKRSLSKNRQKSRIVWNRRSSLRWPQLSEPRQLLEQLASEHNLQIVGLTQIPHDLWPAVDMPPLPLDVQLGLLLIGFDKWYEISPDGMTATIVELPEPEIGMRTFSASANARRLAAELKPRFPDCKISASSSALKAVGPADQLNELQRALIAAQQAEKGSDSQQRFSIQTTELRGNILASLARSLDKKLHYDPELKPLLAERITVKLVQCSIDEIIHSVLDGTELGYKITDDSLSILRK